ncbi:hypothetical protein H0A36_30830, partial [Endozoicomonas sp. SM1973]
KTREVIITAFSNPELFPIVHEIVKQLKDIDGWSFIALKQPRGFSFKISIGDKQLDVKNLLFTPIPNIPNGIQLVAPDDIAKSLSKGEDSEELAWLIVETGIGEKLTGKLEHIEFANSDATEKHKRPISELKNYIEGTP